MVALIILWGGATGKWVWGWQYEEVRRDRDYYRGLHDRKRTQLDRSLGLSEAAVRDLEEVAS